MEFLKKIFGKSGATEFDPAVGAVITGVGCDDITNALGKHKVSSDDFIFWAGALSDLDSDLDDSEFFQISNKNYNKKNSKFSIPIEDRSTWFVIASSEESARALASELGARIKRIDVF